MHKKNKLFLGATIVLLLATVGLAWAYTPNKIYNRPVPLMDYVPQEIAIGDYLYTSLAEDDCRFCHGTSLADRHHYSELALTGFCTPCHLITTTPPYVAVVRNCTTTGVAGVYCHAGADLGPLDGANVFVPGFGYSNGWHHYTQESFVDECIACHDPGVLDRVVDDEYVPFAMYPPTVVTPSPYDCENCHWEQPIVANTVGWTNYDPQAGNPYYTGGVFPDLSDAGHPSTFDHNDAYTAYNMDGSTPGVWNDYFEYGKKIESNYDTHHMLFKGNVVTDCVRCHSVDPDHISYDPTNPELIRYCETCHDVATLHAIEPHVGTGGTGDPPAVNGWEAAGFHIPASNAVTTDVAPGTYRQFSANEQCFGCHGTDLPTWLPEAPIDVPVISDISTQIVACDGVVTLTGNHFGDVKTTDRDVKIRLTTSATWNIVPIMSWTSTQIEFEIPCDVYITGNYKVAVKTETGTSLLENLILSSGATVDSISPSSGLCRETITVTGTDFGAAQDGIPAGQPDGVTSVVQVVSSSGTWQATVYAGWSNTSFQFRFGDFFEDTDADYFQDSFEGLLKQCQGMNLGTYSVYVRTIYYVDVDISSSYTNGDIINQVTVSDPEYFTMDNGLAVYLVLPNQIERSHYCEVMGDATGNEDTICDVGEPCFPQNSIAKIYGWGFGPTQGNGYVYIGTGPMYSGDTGLELNRHVWSDLLIKAAIDVPPVAKGLQLYIWVWKDLNGNAVVDAGEKTNASYGYPGMFILNQETCN